MTLKSNTDTIVSNFEKYIQELDIDNIDVKLHAIQQLGHLGDTNAIEALGEYFSHKNWHVRHFSEKAVEHILEKQPEDTILKYLQESNNHTIRKSAIKVLSKFTSNSIIEALINYLPAVEAVKSLGKIGNRQALLPLIEHFSKKKWENLTPIIQSIESLISSEALEPLIQCLENDNEEKRKYSAYLLGKLKDMNAVEALGPLLKDESLDVKSEAILALGNIGGNKAIDLLIDGLEKASDKEKYAYIEALGNTNDSRAAISLLNCFFDSDPTTRHKASESLGTIGSIEAIPHLTNYLLNKESSIRELALKTLVKMGDIRVKPMLLCLQEDEDRFNRVNALYALRKIADNRAIPYLERYLYDHDYRIVEETIKTIGIIGGNDAVKALDKCFQSKISTSIKKLILINLGKIGDDSSIYTLLKFLKDDNRELRNVARDALIKGKFSKDDFYVNNLTNYLSYSDYKDRESIAFILGELNNSEATETLIGLLCDINSEVKSSVIVALGKIGDESAVNHLIKCLSDNNKRIRRDAEKALEKFGHFVVKQLIKCLSSIDSNTRYHCSKILGNIGDEKAIIPLIHCFSDSDRNVSTNSIEAIVKIGASSIPYLVDWILKEKEGTTEAIKALIKIGDTAKYHLANLGEPSVRHLIKCLTDEDMNYQNFLTIQSALVDIGASAAKQLRDYLSSHNPKIRYLSAQILGKIACETSFETLVFKLLDSDDDVKKSVKNAILEIGNPVTPALTKFIKENSKESTDAIKLLIDLRATSALVDLNELVITDLIHYLCQNNKLLQNYISSVLVLIGQKSINPLINCLSNYRAQYFAKEALTNIGEPSISPLIDYLQNLKSSYEREKVEEILIQIGSPTIKYLLPLMSHENEGFRSSIMIVLKRIDKPVIPHLIEWIKDNKKGTPQAIGILLSFGISINDKIAELGEPVVKHLIPWLKYKEFYSKIKDILTLIGKPSIPSLIGCLESEKLYRDYEKESVKSILIELGPITINPLLQALTEKQLRYSSDIFDILLKIGEEGVPDLIDWVKYENKFLPEIIEILLKINESEIPELVNIGNQIVCLEFTRFNGQIVKQHSLTQMLLG